MSTILTYSGVKFDPLSPVAQDVRIEDIAHALAAQGRYSGHTSFPYTVAEHSVRVSELLSVWGQTLTIRLWGLLHDASEAYLIDLPTPLKRTKEIGEAFKAIEAKVTKAVCVRFALSLDEPHLVKKADRSIRAAEIRDLMPESDYWTVEEVPPKDRIRPWRSDVAEHEFLRLYRLLTGDVRGETRTKRRGSK